MNTQVTGGDSVEVERSPHILATNLTCLFPECYCTMHAQAAAKDKGSQGRVIAVGEGRTTSDGGLAKCHFQPGDNVKFFEYAPVEIKVSETDTRN